MDSIFGDDGLGDLLNDNINEVNELPSDEEANADADNEANNGDQPIKVEPKKKTVRNPRLRLTVDTLRGPRGIHTIEEYFKDIKFRGKGQEKRDLDEIMHRLQHWAHRLYPSYKFEDVVATIERLGRKKPLQVHMARYRQGMLDHAKITENKEQEDDIHEPIQDEPFDEFDALLGEQIAISRLAVKTPSTNRKRTMSTNSNAFNTTPSLPIDDIMMSTPQSDMHNVNYDDDSDLAHPLPPSQPSISSKLTSEQLALIAENRRIAQERLKAKMARLNTFNKDI